MGKVWAIRPSYSTCSQESKAKENKHDDHHPSRFWCCQHKSSDNVDKMFIHLDESHGHVMFQQQPSVYRSAPYRCRTGTVPSYTLPYHDHILGSCTSYSPSTRSILQHCIWYIYTVLSLVNFVCTHLRRISIDKSLTARRHFRHWEYSIVQYSAVQYDGVWRSGEWRSGFHAWEPSTGIIRSYTIPR